MQEEEAASPLDYIGQSSLEPGTSQTTPYETVEAGRSFGSALKVSQPTKELHIISTEPRPHSSMSWSQKNLSPSLDQSLYRPRTKPNIKTPTTKSRKMFSWGDFYLSVGTAKFSLLLTGKLVDHVNGTFSLYFRHNTTRLGNLSVSIVAPSRPLDWEISEPRRKSRNPPEDSEFRFWSPLQSSSSSRTEQQQQQQEKMVTKSLNCWLEYQRTSQAKRTRPCLYDPAQTCYSEHNQSHSAWVCAKPCKVLCILVSFVSLDYKLVQKVCPDYNYQDHHQYFG